MNDSDPAIIVDNKAIDGDFYLLIGLFSLTLDHQLNHRSRINQNHFKENEREIDISSNHYSTTN